MKLATTIFFFLMAEVLSAQIKPELFPEDIAVGDTPVRCYCKPGVRNKSRSKGLQISYASIAEGDFKDEEGFLTSEPSHFNRWTRFEFDIKAPIINRDGFKLLIGAKRITERFNINRFGQDYTDAFQALDAAKLKNTSLSAIVTKPLNEKNYIGVRFRYNANGNYGGLMDFDEIYGVYKVLAAFGIKKHEDFEWGFGLNFSKSFRRTNLLPFIIYNRNFRNSWGIETAFPGYFFGRYNFNPKSILLFGAEYGSDSYRMTFSNEADEFKDYAFNHSELRYLLRLEQQFAPWVWGNLRFGYQMNFSTDFESKNLAAPEFMVDPSNGLFFEIGIFVSPPDHFGHKE